MTVPALLKAAGHIHITEREGDGSFEDCTWCAGLEWYRICFDTSRPATHAEAEALRAASGKPPTGGSNLGDFRRGVAARYHKDLPAAISGFANLKAALTPGHAAVTQGSMSAFGPTNPLSVYDRNFDGGHAVFVANVGGTIYWCDPEAPTAAPVPVVITWAQLEKFVNAFAGQFLVATIRVPLKEDILNTLTSYLPDSDLVIKPQSHIRAAADIQSALLRTVGTIAETHRALGTVKGDVDPANGSDVWYVWFANGHFEFTAKDNVTVKARPATAADDGFTKATQDAAVAAATAPLKATIAALQPLADIGSAAVALIKRAAS